MLNKKTLFGLSAAVLAGSVLLGSSVVSAQETNEFHPFVAKIAERFGLNKSEVQAVYQEHREEMQVERQERQEEHLGELVDQGTLTEEQKNALLQKHEEMQIQRDSFMNLTPEERREAAQSMHSEMRSWMEEQGIEDIVPLNGEQRRAMGGRMGFQGERPF